MPPPAALQQRQQQASCGSCHRLQAGALAPGCATPEVASAGASAAAVARCLLLRAAQSSSLLRPVLLSQQMETVLLLQMPPLAAAAAALPNQQCWQGCCKQSLSSSAGPMQRHCKGPGQCSLQLDPERGSAAVKLCCWGSSLQAEDEWHHPPPHTLLGWARCKVAAAALLMAALRSRVDAVRCAQALLGLWALQQWQPPEDAHG